MGQEAPDTETVTETDADADVDVDGLQQMNVEYAAALRSLLGEDFDKILDDNLMHKRDGTIIFNIPEPDTQNEQNEQTETAETADTKTDTQTETAEKKPPLKKARTPFAGRQKEPAKKTSYTDMTSEQFDAALVNMMRGTQ